MGVVRALLVVAAIVLGAAAALAVAMKAAGDEADCVEVAGTRVDVYVAAAVAVAAAALLALAARRVGR